ncbi:MAG: MBL fold metallo-hydrolase, partial [Actinomycetota bacterium]
MEVIVLGASGTYPTADAAASGFLVIAGDTKVWLDAGPGTFQNLQRHIEFHDVSAVVLSHMHLDHVLDFYAFHYALAYDLASRGPKALPVFAPKGSEPYLLSLRPDGFEGHFNFEVIDSVESLRLGQMDWTFALTRHPQTCLA